LQIQTKIVSCHTADSKPVKQEVNGTVILPPLVFPDQGIPLLHARTSRKCRRALSIPHSVILTVSMRDYYINSYLYKSLLSKITFNKLGQISKSLRRRLIWWELGLSKAAILGFMGPML
jgi:hypothetical protein